MVTVVLPGVLRGDAGGASRLTLQSRAGVDTRAGDMTLARVLDEIAGHWPRLERRLRDERGVLRRYVNVYVDGEECRRLAGLATVVPDGAEIYVLPSVAGG